ncbi:MAG: tetratricopeptide repeat protein [Peptoniphilaceae bacterium]
MTEKINKKYLNYIIIANEFLEQENLNKALISFKRAYKFATNNNEKIDALFEIADIYLLEDRTKESIEIYNEILDIDKSRSGAYYGIAVANEIEENNIEYSIENYKLAIKYDKDYDRAYYYLAHLYDKINLKDKAIDCLKKCIEIDNLDYISYNDLGSFYEERKEYDLAFRYISKSLEINSNYFRALYNMGVLEKAKGNNDKALYYYNKAKEESSYPFIYLNMSAIYIERLDYVKAIEILNEGLKENEEAVNLYYNRACCYSKLNIKSLALKDLKKAININKEAYNWAKTDLDLIEIVEMI